MSAHFKAAKIGIFHELTTLFGAFVSNFIFF